MLRLAAIPFGVSFLFGAALLVFAACGVVPSAHSLAIGDVPWIVTVATVFAMVGVGCVLWARGYDALAAIVIRCSLAIVAAGFIVALNWVAFGSGLREFTISAGWIGGHASIGPMDAATNARVGRSVFGIFAVVLDLIVLSVVVSWSVYWRNNRRRRNR